MPVTPSFDRRVLHNELTDLCFFPGLENGPVKNALGRVVASYQRALSQGMKAQKNGNECHDALRRLETTLETQGMRAEDIPNYAALRDVLDRILLLRIAPVLRMQFYRDMRASSKVAD